MDDEMNEQQMPEPLQATALLRTVFGYEAFRGQQEEIIAAAVHGQDALVLMPTGGGKSICYQIPALQRPGVGLVVSPLIALMQDQVAALREAGVKAAFLNSTLSPAEQSRVSGQLSNGELDLLYLAPERLNQPATRSLLSRCELAIIAIDEAHCVSQWGHDFRQDYLLLNTLADDFPGVPRMALTATATPAVAEEIEARLALVDPQRFVSSFDRPNIRYSVEPKSDGRRQLQRFLGSHSGSAGIVYCLSRAKVESTASFLRKQGYHALPYHAGLDTETRAENQHRFLHEEGVVMVATIAFGMGIDKPDVRFVAHLDLPKSIEAYYQETGRAGRDNQPAEAWMIYGLQDVVRLRQMMDASQADELFKRRERERLDSLLGWCETTQCRRRPLLAYFGEERPQDCGNCDNCLRPPATWDGTQAAQMLLSAVYRSGQRFGAAHVTDILLGKETDKIFSNNHHLLSVFGIGQQIDSKTWRSVIRQVIVAGFLRADADRFGALVLTEAARPLLRGETTLQLRKDRTPPKKSKGRAGKPALVIAESDMPLWESLRELRQTLATEHNVPPYVIFHDSTLQDMLAQRPATLTALLEVSGVGQKKAQRYGQAFLDVLNS